MPRQAPRHRPHPFAGAVTALALTVCSPGADDVAPEPGPEPDAAAAASVAPGRDAAYAAAREGPEPFVRALYARYAAPAQPLPPGQDPLYGRMMNARVGADAARPGGATVTDDPLCGCRPGDAVAITSLAVAQAGPAEATADVAFTVSGQPRRRTLTLLREGPMWRVADIAEPGQAAVSERLMRGL